ncbi:hypothetical protein L1049_001404 [Liquidambar formosana]|uniref:Cation/H+ exchanger transmembrane domain-containing protein n=1 Tax=Liquidambar formosana TaxID=63359 RepID=A0AAP0NAJ2_LIQFO
METMSSAVYELAKNLASGHAQVVPITVFVAVLCLCLVVGHMLEENRWMNESITAILIGLISGIIILCVSKWKSSHILRFDEELFFIYLLPPIIFNAGFQVKKKQFFHNFLTIMMFGVIGVFISSVIISTGSVCIHLILYSCQPLHFANSLMYGSIGTIFSSTDTVCTLQVLHQDETPLLYSLVFGEGVVNDATAVVLFNAVQKIDVTRMDGSAALHIFGDFLYLFSTSTALGVAFGLLTAYALKTLYFGRHSTVREIAVMHLFATMSFIAETSIFLYVGMDALDIEKWKMSKLSFGTSIGIYSTLILLILLGRAAFVFPLSALSNCMNRNSEGSSSITFKHQVIIWWAGLMRGAVSIALAFKQFTYYGVTLEPVNATMVTITIIVVLFTTLVFGFLTKPLINYLLPQNSHNNTNHQEPKSPKEDMSLPFLSFDESSATNLHRAKDSLSMLMERPVYTIHFYWRKFDDTYMRPIFGGPPHDHSTC